MEPLGNNLKQPSSLNSKKTLTGLLAAAIPAREVQQQDHRERRILER